MLKKVTIALDRRTGARYNTGVSLWLGLILISCGGDQGINEVNLRDAVEVPPPFGV